MLRGRGLGEVPAILEDQPAGRGSAERIGHAGSAARRCARRSPEPRRETC